MVNIDYIFHIGYERCAPFRWDFPVLPEMRLKFVFLSARCTVICETLGASFNSTAFSASSRTVHRRRPSGASEQANAISRASKAPSKITSRGGFSGCLRSSATASPSSTKRCFRCSIVRGVTPIASATSATVQAGPAARHHTGAKRVRKGTVSHSPYLFSKHRVPDVLAQLTSHGIAVSWQIPPHLEFA